MAEDVKKEGDRECPVCYKKVQIEILERHVNECLNCVQNEVSSSEMRKSKRARVDITSWCTASKLTSPVSNSTAKKSLTQSPVSNKRELTKTMASPLTSVETPQSLPSNVEKKDDSKTPLAEQMRPKSMDEFVGQNHILQQNSMLRKLINNENIPSMILWGPPGCGKTSLANVIGKSCKNSKFVSLSATSAGVAQVKDLITQAKSEWNFFKRKTILFLDEIHRFNKLQQDTFLPIVENGTICLIGATTENPSFSLNSALLSRCKVFTFNKLSSEDLKIILQQAIQKLSIMTFQENPVDSSKCGLFIEDEALTILADLSDGDARMALNCLNLLYQTFSGNVIEQQIIKVSDVKESLARTHLLYDRKGDEHYNCISALHKSMRGDDADAALYWLGRMLEGGEDPLYVARRLIRFASEDIGMADPNALQQAVAAYQACHAIGMPECEVILAQCVVYMAEASKSVRVYRAYSRVKECIKSHQGPLPGVPLHLRNAPTTLMKQLGYGKDYKYNPDCEGEVEQEYLPEGLIGTKFLDPE